jgi:hypothetical protein
MTEDQKKFFYYIESMRDGCTKEVLVNYLSEDQVNKFIEDFLEKKYIYTADGLIFINYEKINVDTWNDVQIL